MGTGVLNPGESGRGVKLATHLHLIPTSRMRGTIPPLSQYVFMAWHSVQAQGAIYSGLNPLVVTLFLLT